MKRGKPKQAIAVEVEQSLQRLSHLANMLYQEVEKYLDALPSPIPGAVKKVISPVYAYCLRAPLELGRAYDLKTYEFEVRKCITSYMARTMSVFNEVVAKNLAMLKEGEFEEEEKEEE